MMTHFLVIFFFQGDDEPLHDLHVWRTVFGVMSLNDQGTRYAKHDLRGNMFEQAQNVKNSYVESKTRFLIYVCGIGMDWGHEHESCHNFIFEINFLQDFELDQAWFRINVS